MKLIINIKGKPQTLTYEEAEALYKELHTVFKNKETEYIPYYPYWPIPAITYDSTNENYSGYKGVVTGSSG